MCRASGTNEGDARSHPHGLVWPRKEKQTVTVRFVSLILEERGLLGTHAPNPAPCKDLCSVPGHLVNIQGMATRWVAHLCNLVKSKRKEIAREAAQPQLCPCSFNAQSEQHLYHPGIGQPSR
jgi:hypothetical protein